MTTTAADVTKRYREGTHRAVPPTETLRRTLPAARAAGITRVANVTGLDRIGIPVFMACRPLSRSVSVSQGKGLHPEAARASAVMEGIELWHAETIDEPLLLSRYADLRRRVRVVDVDALPSVPHSRFRRDLPLLWIRGHDLVGDEDCWVPLECVSMDATVPAPTGAGCFLATSNGLASGNTHTEALCHALDEVVERDATTLWHRRPNALEDTLLDLDLDSGLPDHVARAVARCRSAGVRVQAWDLTSDVGVPCYAALISEPEVGGAYLRAAAHGYGCHLDPGVALSRAVTEAVQSRLTYVAGSRDDLFPGEYADDVSARQRLAECERLLEVEPPRSLADRADISGETFEDDAATLLTALTSVGVREAIRVDLTKPDLGIPVVRVVVPGLEGPDSDPDHVPGRRSLGTGAA